MHGAKIAGVTRIAAPHVPIRVFNQHDTRACFARSDSGAEAGITATDYQYIGFLTDQAAGSINQGSINKSRLIIASCRYLFALLLEHPD